MANGNAGGRGGGGSNGANNNNNNNNGSTAFGPSTMPCEASHHSQNYDVDRLLFSLDHWPTAHFPDIDDADGDLLSTFGNGSISRRTSRDSTNQQVDIRVIPPSNSESGGKISGQGQPLIPPKS